MVVREEIGPDSKEVMVFVHGAGMAGWMWDMQREAFPDMRALVVDLPDHGSAAGVPFSSVEDEADGLAGLLEERGLQGRAHLVGHSLGAKIVLCAVARHGGLARSAVISSALTRPSALASMMDSRALSTLSAWMLRNEALARMQGRQFGFPTEAMLGAFVDDVCSTTEERLYRPIAAFCASLFLPEGLGGRDCPALVTVGSKEPRSMKGSAEDIARALPRATLRTLEGADHCYPWKRYREYNALLRAWVDGNGRLSAGNGEART